MDLLGRSGLIVLLAIALFQTSCGSSDSTSAHLPATDQPYIDTAPYSPHADDALEPSQVNEHAAVMHHRWNLDDKTIHYTTTTGHLTATSPSVVPQATMSYVAYTALNTDGSPRPLTFFYNGGPGSSSI